MCQAILDRVSTSDGPAVGDATLASAISAPDRTAPIDATIRADPAEIEASFVRRLAPISLAFPDANDGARGDAELDADLTVVRVLGRGGMGIVYLARQRALGRDVAVKVANGSVPQLNASLVAEAMMMGSLEHPNIVPVHVLGTDAETRPVLVMKRVEGVVWSELLTDDAHPAWSVGDLRGEEHLTAHLQILMQVANALEYAHSRGVVHRDVKPDNVMLGPFGEVYLLDWGVALRLGHAHRAFELVGTPAYFAPEMAAGHIDRIDARTDVYLLGATLHFVLTRRHRHDASDPTRAIALALESEPFEYGAEVPPELATLCNDATSRDKDRRPASAAAFRLAISAYLRHRSSNVVAASAQTQLDKLHAELAEGAPISGVEIAQRMAECRFGFHEALRAWSGNVAARRGLDACLAQMVERELAQRNVSAARAILAEITTPDAALVGRLELIEAEIATARERGEQAARAARDLDASISWAPRAVLLSIFLVGVIIANVWTTVKEVRSGVASPITDTLLADAAQLLAVFIGLATTARYLLGTRYNRRVVGVALCATITVTVVDLVAWSQHLGSRSANLFDSVVMMACFTIASLGVEPGWWRIVAVWLGSTALCATAPALSTGTVGIATVLTAVIGIQVARRGAARERTGALAAASPSPSP